MHIIYIHFYMNIYSFICIIYSYLCIRYIKHTKICKWELCNSINWLEIPPWKVVSSPSWEVCRQRLKCCPRELLETEVLCGEGGAETVCSVTLDPQSWQLACWRGLGRCLSPASPWTIGGSEPRADRRASRATSLDFYVGGFRLPGNPDSVGMVSLAAASSLQGRKPLTMTPDRNPLPQGQPHAKLGELESRKWNWHQRRAGSARYQGLWEKMLGTAASWFSMPPRESEPERPGSKSQPCTRWST